MSKCIGVSVIQNDQRFDPVFVYEDGQVITFDDHLSKVIGRKIERHTPSGLFLEYEAIAYGKSVARAHCLPFNENLDVLLEEINNA